MFFNAGQGSLINKRIQTTFSKSKDLHSKGDKVKDKNYSMIQQGFNFNLSVDVKNHVSKQNPNFFKHRPSNTINFESEQNKVKKRNSLMIIDSKREADPSNAKSVKLAYGNSPKSIKPRISMYTSQKSIKEKKKRFSTDSGAPQENELLEHSGINSPKTNLNSKQNQTVNIEKHMIISKYQKAKQMLKNQKYSQASVYLKQVIPFIDDKDKKKQLYFWLIASLMKSNTHNKFQVVENYIFQCLEKFPNFYDVYLYWAKVKVMMDLKEQAIEIYEKAIKINPKSSQAYLQLSKIYLKDNQNQQAFKVLNEGFAQVKNSVSIPVRIVQNYKIFNLSLTNNISPYVERIQQNCGKKSTQLLYILGFIQNQKNNDNQAIIFFMQSLKYNSNKTLATKSLQCIIKIHISKKDFYAACYDLKRSKHLNIELKKIQKYEIFLEGVNFVMKKQNEQGIKLLNKIKESCTKPNPSKKRFNTMFSACQPQTQKAALFEQDDQIFSLTIKYLAYAYFKLGNHRQTIKCYHLLQKINPQLDNISKYNLLLAQGIIYADSNHDFESSFKKFQEAKSYLNKVEPWIYQSIVTIQKTTFRQKNNPIKTQIQELKMQEELNTSVVEALNLMEEGFKINSSSSNLLYHRTILQLYFSSLKAAMHDINLCIQKAEQNLPKYFYLRGMCFACMKNLKKAINQFSISISLSKQYSISYLERAKCYFLSGQTDSGFQDLKTYMDQCPQDFHVHKWIGDLLFQGTSYTDSIKAYNEMGQNITLDALCMKLKAQIRTSSIKQISQTIHAIKSHEDFIEQNFEMDFAAFNLLSSLINMNQTSCLSQKQKQSISNKVQILNQFLQGQSQRSKVFNLVDCMCIVGIGSFYIEKYNQAYQAFLLVLEFLKSTKGQNGQHQHQQILDQDNIGDESVRKQKFNTQFQEEILDLREQDVYYNLFLCLFAMKDFQSLLNLVNEEMINGITNKTQRKVIEKITNFLSEKLFSDYRLENSSLGQGQPRNSSKTKQKKQTTNNFILEPRLQTPLNCSLKKTDLSITLDKSTINVKTSLIWSSYHGSNENLNFTQMAKKLIYNLHAGYIDNMPEGPWIRRNQFGVLFTDNILDQGNQSSFITTKRSDPQGQKYQKDEEQYDATYEIYREESQYQQSQEKLKVSENGAIDQKKKAFLKEIKLDLKIQSKLKKIIQKSD